MAGSVTIEAKILGQRREFPGWDLPLLEVRDGEHVRLCDLITRVVREEVSAFQERQEQRKLLQVLTPNDIALGVARGKVDLGGRDLDQAIDPDSAIGTALRAFEDGLYFVFVDGEQQLDLDQEVFLRPGGRVSFVRLTPLAGG
jgi:hypothetical protein